MASSGAKALQEGVASLAPLVEQLDAASVMRDINEDRQASGFPAIADLALVQAELTNRKRYYQRTITDLLDASLSAEQLVSVYERLIAESTSDGAVTIPHLIRQRILFTDTYESDTKAELDKRALKKYRR